ncbi:hypothetical protein FS749_009768 [Ceratobasidium sp. UAMH 11750]|nr:hypothetical protein FS749_009768 [Ceratobasidium sp. UAMH 11750]
MPLMYDIVVLGAGVVGLSTALKLQDRGYNCTIISEYLPGDKKTIEYTSPWAGAHHVSRAEGDKVQEAYDFRTFETMWSMSEPGHPASGCFMRIHQIERFVKQPSSAYSSYGFMPGHRLVRDEAEDKVTVEFETVTIDTSVYLPYLLSTFLSNGGRVIRTRVGHLSQVAQGAHTGSKPDLIVVCTGIGTRSLGGVEDQDVFPIRGQTVLIRAPWINFGISEKNPDCISYIIPRQSGDVSIRDSWLNYSWVCIGCTGRNVRNQRLVPSRSSRNH